MTPFRVPVLSLQSRHPGPPCLAKWPRLSPSPGGHVSQVTITQWSEYLLGVSLPCSAFDLVRDRVPSHLLQVSLRAQYPARSRSSVNRRRRGQTDTPETRSSELMSVPTKPVSCETKIPSVFEKASVLSVLHKSEKRNPFEIFIWAA